MEPLFLAFLGHMVGDYVFQTDWMAKNQKSLPCLVHSLIWAGCVVLFASWGWVPFLVLGTVHFLQDRTQATRHWMHLIGQDHFATGPYAPWSTVVIDNTFHLVQIWLIWKFLS